MRFGPCSRRISAQSVRKPSLGTSGPHLLPGREPPGCEMVGTSVRGGVRDENGRDRLSGRRQPHRVHRRCAAASAGRREPQDRGAVRHLGWRGVRPAGLVRPVDRRDGRGRPAAGALLAGQCGHHAEREGGERLAGRAGPAGGAGVAADGEPLRLPGHRRPGLHRPADPPRRRRSAGPAAGVPAGGPAAAARRRRRRPHRGFQGLLQPARGDHRERRAGLGGRSAAVPRRRGAGPVSTGTGCSARTRRCASCPTPARRRSG